MIHLLSGVDESCKKNKNKYCLSEKNNNKQTKDKFTKFLAELYFRHIWVTKIDTWPEED